MRGVYIKLDDLQYPVYEGDIRLAHPDIGATFVCPPGYAEVQWTPEPACDNKTQRAYQKQPRLENGAWKMVWAVRPCTQEELDAMAQVLEQRQMRADSWPTLSPHTSA